jgi:hypothetical protein
MAVGMSSTVAQNVLNAIFNNTAYSVAEVWVQLHIGDPGAAGTSNLAAETDRQQLSAATASGATITSDAALTWTSITGSEDPTHFSLWSSSAGGTFLGSGAITSAAYAAGNTFTIPAGDWDLNLTVAA